MTANWLRRILPLISILCILFAQVLLAASSSTTQDGTGSLREESRHLPTPDGQDTVELALRILRESKIPLVKREKPSGLLGYGFHYAKQAFSILFMNGPQDESTLSKHQRLHPTLARAVSELNAAAEDAYNPDAMFLLAEMNFYGNFTHPRNFEEAFRWYHKLASMTGNNTAQYMIGFMYATGLGGAVEQDQAKALMYHNFAAEAGNTRSEMTLAFRHHVGIGASRNCDRAVRYYKRVADKAIAHYRSGPPGGHSMVREAYRWADEEGGVYGEGASVSSSGPNANQNNAHSSAEASLEDVLEYFDIMSKKGDVKATFSLGKLHYDGARTLPRNFRKAMKYFRTVARLYWTKDGSILANHLPGIDKVAPKAAGYIGMMYLRGEGVETNFDTAAMWFRRGIANGDALCQHQLGLMYLHGYGVPEDAYRASSYFKAAAEDDFPAAETRLGALFLDQGDVETASKYFELAARYGWMEAFYYLAEIANNGIGRERHCGIASAYYKMVAEKAEAIHSSFSESNAAYSNGDMETALMGALMAAEQGYENAQANVAFLLDEQRSVLSLSSILHGAQKYRPSLLRNAALALIYWTRSARQSNVDSLVKMGDYYLAGIGTKPDPEKAATCYHTAAEAHHSAQAYWNLGWMHENGIAVEQDFYMAKRYYDLALETNQEAYFPVKLSLIKLRIRDFWDRLTHGNVNPIQDEKESRPPRTFKEWIITFLENDEEEEARYAQLYGQYDDADGMRAGGPTGRRTDSERRNEDNGYYDDLDLDIDENLLEGLVIVTLAATLLILVYIRQQRLRQRENANNAAAAGAGPANNNNNNDRGLFPQPGQPEFGQWVAGGVGH